MPASEAEMMQRYVSGEPRAFEQLYQQVGPPLFRYLLRMANDHALAEDLLQLTFLKVHRARSAYVLGAAPMPWLYAIAHRTFLDEARRRKRARVQLSPSSDLPEQAASLRGNDVRYEREPIDADQLAAVMAALDELPTNQKQAVLLTKIEGKSIADAARIAGTTPGAMKLRTHRGYQALRNRLRQTETKSGDDQ